MRSFCNAKAPHIFSAKNISTLDFRRTRRLNESLTNDFVKLTMLWTSGPCYLPTQNFQVRRKKKNFFLLCPKKRHYFGAKLFINRSNIFFLFKKDQNNYWVGGKMMSLSVNSKLNIFKVGLNWLVSLQIDIPSHSIKPEIWHLICTSFGLVSLWDGGPPRGREV